MSLLRLGVGNPANQSVEPFSMGTVGPESVEPFDIDQADVIVTSIEPFDVLGPASSGSVEPFMLGQTIAVGSVEPFSIADALTAYIGTGPASPVIGWRDSAS